MLKKVSVFIPNDTRIRIETDAHFRSSMGLNKALSLPGDILTACLIGKKNGFEIINPKICEDDFACLARAFESSNRMELRILNGNELFITASVRLFPKGSTICSYEMMFLFNTESGFSNTYINIS